MSMISRLRRVLVGDIITKTQAADLLLFGMESTVDDDEVRAFAERVEKEMAVWRGLYKLEPDTVILHLSQMKKGARLWSRLTFIGLRVVYSDAIEDHDGTAFHLGVRKVGPTL